MGMGYTPWHSHCKERDHGTVHHEESENKQNFRPYAHEQKLILCRHWDDPGVLRHVLEGSKRLGRIGPGRHDFLHFKGQLDQLPEPAFIE